MLDCAAGARRSWSCISRPIELGRNPRGARRERAHAAIGLAPAFGTWQRLARSEGLTDDEAAELMARAVGAA